tara:strand:- start:147 stop:809 length:663 start_codon:yes stop_codon:yes gene_type:complete
MRVTKSGFALLVALFLGFSQISVASENWESNGVKDGVSLYTKAYEGEALKAFRGNKVFNASIKQIYWVLQNPDSKFRMEWVDRLYISERLESPKSLGVPHSSIIYQAYKLPWPISNRDQVVKTSAKRDGKNLIITLKSTLNDKKPTADTIGVRMELLYAVYNLNYVDENKTDVTVSVRIDSKGAIPTWLSNLINKTWPVKTLNALEKQTAKYNGENFSMP